MGGANNRSLISAHFCISAYFLTAETYKRMRLTTRVYGSMIRGCSGGSRMTKREVPIQATHENL